MNYKLLTLILILCIPFLGSSTDLQTAISQNIIEAHFLGNGAHRNKCLKLLTKNNTNEKVKIQILPGTYLENKDSSRQDIVIVENEFFVLAPNEKRELILKGFCCKRRRGSPLKGDPFIVRKEIDLQIAELCKLLLELKEFEYAGQEAIWSLVGNDDPNNIVGEDSSNTMQLRQYVGEVLGKKVKPFIWTSYGRPAMVTQNELSIRSEGNHYVRQVKENDLVEYAIYNEADSAVSNIISERVVANRWNKHNCKWKFVVENLNPTKRFFMRIKVNGTIQKEWMYYWA